MNTYHIQHKDVFRKRNTLERQWQYTVTTPKNIPYPYCRALTPQIGEVMILLFGSQFMLQVHTRNRNTKP